MNPDPDHDLRARFSAQRRADHNLAPAWNPRAIQAMPKAPVFGLPRWLPIAAAALVCLLLGLTFFHRRETPDLVEALPVLFESPDEPLFASLEPASNHPSDFLLPTHLTIQLP